MTTNFKRIFGATKPVIGMVHIGALPGSPLFDPAFDLVAGARADLLALQDAGFDAVMFGNENDRPYELNVDTASTAAMASVIGQLKSEITVPFGVNVLWDPMSTIALGVATGAAFVRDHIIRVTERAFDDFADGGTDEAANRKMLGLT